MPQDKIVVVGARQHNLKNITVEIPRDKLVVITGLSGSGKSSLAFDTIYAEGQRRYVESLSAYARQFLGQMDKPDVDHIDGLSPAVSIDQKGASKNPRSTVGTVTEIYDYLRVLFARVGTPHCPQCGEPITRQSVEQITDAVLGLPTGSKIQVLAPLVRGRKGEYRQVLQDVHRQGFVRVRVDGLIYEVTDDIPMDRYKQHTVEAVVDRLVVKEGIEQRLADSIETGLRLGKGHLVILGPNGDERMFSEQFACPRCDISIGEIEPRTFSFNSPYGACSECTGLGFRREFDIQLMVPDTSKSVSEGALAPFMYKSGEPKSWYHELFEAVAERVGFDIDTPFRDLAPEHVAALMDGVEGKVSVRLGSRFGRARYFETDFPGVKAILRKKYDQTESDWVKQDLEQYMAERPCPACGGKRLKPEALSVTLNGRAISDVTSMSVSQAAAFFAHLPKELRERERFIASRLIKEIRERLDFLAGVGVGYLTLDRTARTLAGGEAQRIRLATQIGSGLMGVLYILDEPSIGLHQRDNRKLIGTLERLRDLGNTVIVVEHDEETMLAADHIIDLGPGAGEHGGHVVAEGTVEQIRRTPGSITGAYLRGERAIPVPSRRRPVNDRWFIIHGARAHNLKNIEARIPLGVFVCVTGVSGSGKSTLIQETLFPRLMYHVYGTRTVWGPHDGIEGIEHVDKVVDIDQSPIGRTPRSNPATYTGAFNMIRDLFARTTDARVRGYKPGRFSFNVKGGRCEACQGDGIIKIEMHFLPDVYVPCEVCKGKRYNRETLEVKYKGKSIAEVLEMTVEEALEFFGPVPPLKRKIGTLMDVGLGYIRLGQPATTLSGGEAQRIKLADHLSKRSTGRTVYILDEPTTGLHFEDVNKLLGVLHRLVDQGNSVIVIEHNLDVIKTADWVLDMGPEGGDEGGQVIAEGTPEQVAATRGTYTGRYLKAILKAAPRGEFGVRDDHAVVQTAPALVAES
ncbi:MAG: excinuclease ABC subunit UvrA [Fimbriimonadia bacterium]|jgi:excinuclease ABC subunit A